MYMHKDKTEPCGIGPTDLGDFDGKRFIGGREFHMEGEAGTGGQRFLAHDVTAFGGEAGDEPASDNGIARKSERHLDFIPRTVASLHNPPFSDLLHRFGQKPSVMDTLFRRQNQPAPLWPVSMTQVAGWDLLPPDDAPAPFIIKKDTGRILFCSLAPLAMPSRQSSDGDTL